MPSPRRMLITGTSRGLGRSLAEHYLGLGDEVMGCSRGAGSIEHEAYGHLAVDLTEPDEVEDLLGRVRERFGGLDVLINNAGIAAMNPVALTPFDTTRHVMDVNFHATCLCTQQAIRLLRHSDAPRIVNLTTIAVPLRLEGEAAYAASKSAVETFTRIAARELAGFGITCNAVGPSPVPTDLIKGIDERKLQALLDRQAVKRMARADDVANVVDFFLRPESSMVTGQIVYLGGVG